MKTESQRNWIQVLSSVLAFVCVSLPLFATAEVLPKNTWRFSLRSDAKTITSISSQTYNQNGTENGDYKFYKARDITAKNIQAFQPLIANGLISAELNLLEKGYDSNYSFDIAYGLSEKLSVGISIPYRNRVLRYSDEYVNAFKTLDQLASAGAIPGLTGDNITVPPKEAKGSGFGDITIGRANA